MIIRCWTATTKLVLVASVALFSFGAVTAVAQTAPAGSIAGATSTTSPDAATDTSAPAIALSEEEMEAMLKRRDAIREATSSKVGGTARGGDRLSRETREGAESEATSIRRNFRNTRAQAVSSTLAEPAAANDAAEVFYSGNTYFSRSADRGATWIAQSIPAGPADAPFACCDNDVVHHSGLDTTFATILYTNSAQTNGVVRIFVKRSTISGGNDCTYTIDPGWNGQQRPAGLSPYRRQQWLSLPDNEPSPERFVMDRGADQALQRDPDGKLPDYCNYDLNYTGSDGQRILTPVEGATTTMYFGLNRTANLFRVIRLAESATSLSIFDRGLSHGSNFVNPDCRGGTGNFDFIERSTSWSIAGFRLRGAVIPGNKLWFIWNTGPDASHTQAHLHSAILTEPGLTVLASPAVFNNTRCFGYPTIGGNSFGEFGLTFAHGGRKFGGGSAAQGAVR